MTIRKARPKQVWKPPTAADHNAMAAAADMYRRGPDATPQRQQPVNANVIMVRNDSGADKRRGDVLAVTKTKLLTTLTREHPWVTADGLDAANRNYILCVLLDPLPDGKIGPAQISGVGLAYVNVTAAWHRRAFPHGAATVQSGLFGPLELLSAPTVTGEQLCHVKIGHADNRSVVAKVGRSGISAARRSRRCLTLGSGTVSLYGPNGTVGQHCLLTDAQGSPLTVTAYNAKCEGIGRNKTVRLEPGDDWLPLALDPSCEESSSSSVSSNSDSSSSDSSSSHSSSGSSSEESSSEFSSSEFSSEFSSDDSSSESESDSGSEVSSDDSISDGSDSGDSDGDSDGDSGDLSSGSIDTSGSDQTSDLSEGSRDSSSPRPEASESSSSSSSSSSGSGGSGSDDCPQGYTWVKAWAGCDAYYCTCQDPPNRAPTGWGELVRVACVEEPPYCPEVLPPGSGGTPFYCDWIGYLC